MNRYRIAIFASGEGSNAENITNYFKGYDAINVVLIVSNRADVGVMLFLVALGSEAINMYFCLC